MDNGLVAGLITLAVVVLVVLLVWLNPRLRSVFLELPGLRIKVRGRPAESPARPSGIRLRRSKLRRSPIDIVEGSQADVGSSELDDSSLTVRERRPPQER